MSAEEELPAIAGDERSTMRDCVIAHDRLAGMCRNSDQPRVSAQCDI